MDLEENKKRQTIRVLISEFFMVIAVIVMVVALVMIVSGYWISSDFEVGRSGLLQVSSVPTGATVTIDGEGSWLQRTNTSKILHTGEHEVVVSKEGYDSWTKTVNIQDGLLYRLHYPRLFLQNRAIEEVTDVAGNTKASVSPDHESLLLMNETNEWSLVNLDSEKVEPKVVDLSLIPTTSSVVETVKDDDEEVEPFLDQVVSMDWNYNGDRILFELEDDWILLNLTNVEKSIVFSDAFDMEFDNMQIIDDAGNNFIAVQNGNLRKIDISSKLVSAILVEDVIDFDHYDNELIFIAQNADDEYYIGDLKLSETKAVELDLADDVSRVLVYKFYEDKYLFEEAGQTVRVLNKEDLTVEFESELSFVPENVEVGHNGEFIFMHSGSRIAVLDMESLMITEWNTDGSTFDWLDNDMIYSVNDGELLVYDYDGLNRRSLAKNVSERFPVMITNDKWLYYVSDGMLTREWLIAH